MGSSSHQRKQGSIVTPRLCLYSRWNAAIQFQFLKNSTSFASSGHWETTDSTNLPHQIWPTWAIQFLFSLVLLQLLSHVWLLQPHGLQPASLLCLWDFQGKNTGTNHKTMKIKREMLSASPSNPSPNLVSKCYGAMQNLIADGISVLIQFEGGPQSIPRLFQEWRCCEVFVLTLPWWWLLGDESLVNCFLSLEPNSPLCQFNLSCLDWNRMNKQRRLIILIRKEVKPWPF